jgi:hypothetical protein
MVNSLITLNTDLIGSNFVNLVILSIGLFNIGRDAVSQSLKDKEQEIRETLIEVARKLYLSMETCASQGYLIRTNYSKDAVLLRCYEKIKGSLTRELTIQVLETIQGLILIIDSSVATVCLNYQRAATGRIVERLLRRAASSPSHVEFVA